MPVTIMELARVGALAVTAAEWNRSNLIQAGLWWWKMRLWIVAHRKPQTTKTTKTIRRTMTWRVYI